MSIDQPSVVPLVATEIKQTYRLDLCPNWRDPDHAAFINAAGNDIKLLDYLEQSVNTELHIEGALIQSRRYLLHRYVERGRLSESELRFASALAAQCFNNEYLYPLDERERGKLESLAVNIRALSDWQAVLMYLLYAPLSDLPASAIDGLRLGPAWASGLAMRLHDESLRQQALADGVPGLRDVADDVSIAVRDQYERNPYPRWLPFSLPPPAPAPERLVDALKRDFPSFEPSNFSGAPMEMLVAGCGTGRQSIRMAAAHPDINVLAVDFSRASLGYAAHIAQQLGVDNIRFLHADLLDLPSLGRKFPVIECAGVLHHMADPMTGWRALTECLMPGGVMQIGLYGERGRAPVIRLRERIKAMGLENATLDQMRTFRMQLIESNDPDLAWLTRWADFFSLSEFRDLLFHVSEQRFTLSQIKRMLAELSLSFLGFVPPNVALQETYRQRYPDDTFGLDLDRWDALEREFPERSAAFYYFGCQKRID